MPAIETPGTPANRSSGFLSADADEAYGRPVGVALDVHGALLVADDVGNTVWRVSSATPSGGRAKPGG
jgi:glucose/arabinose dehydrogenase